MNSRATPRAACASSCGSTSAASTAPANQWHLYRAAEDHPDSPSWGSQATDCDAPLDDQVMLWGGPWVTWRWDNTDSSLRLMSVREIVPPTNMPPIP